MIQTLATLVKITDKKLDDLQRDIADVNAAINGAIEQQKHLAATAEAGFDAGNRSGDMPVMTQASSYAARAKQEIEDISQALSLMYQQRDALQGQLRELFAEKKRYETIKERKELDAKKEREKKEQNALDEAAAMR